MRIHIRRRDFDCRFELRPRILIATFIRVYDAEIKVLHRDIRVRLLNLLQQGPCVVHLVHPDFCIRQVKHRLHMMRIIRNLGFELLCRLRVVPLRPQ